MDNQIISAVPVLRTIVTTTAIIAMAQPTSFCLHTFNWKKRLALKKVLMFIAITITLLLFMVVTEVAMVILA